jgi:hypothetical protein
MSELRRLLGPVMFRRLCELAGGTRVRVPKHFGKPPTGGRDTAPGLTAKFGEPLALLLVFHFGDSSIHVPKPQGSERYSDRGKLKRLANRPGMSANDIARKLGCDRRTVETYRSRNRQTGRSHDG